MAFTLEQLDAINRDGNNIIVSAGAGSGKTAVLTERVIRKLKSGVKVNQLLVLTFTNEAANEMKNRIRDAILVNNLQEQLDLLDSANITTFDSFAFGIVKKYHYLLNISNNVSIVDSNIITIKKRKLLENIFEKRYGNDKFNNLINTFCIKDDKNLKDYIIDLTNKLELLLDQDKFIEDYSMKYYSEFFINTMIDNYIKIIKNKIIELNLIHEKILFYVDEGLKIKLDNWLNYLYKGLSYEDYTLFLTINPPRFTKISEEGLKLKDELKNKVEEIKNLLVYKDTNEIKNTYYSTKDNVLEILDIIKEINKEINTYKKKYDIYEFNDIAHMAIKVVKENIDIKNELMYFFNEIMVDEYQDTSTIQEEFINLISNNNVYMVGDIKQSIYRFRNANPYIFQNKYDNYSKNNGGIKIDLLKNFRSREETLFNINEIFNLIMDNEIGNAKYLESHNMIYGNIAYDLENAKHDNHLEIYNYDNQDKEFSREEKELFIISKDILEKINNKYLVFDKKTSKLRPIKYSDICIITDRNTYLDTYKKILEYNDIPSVLYKDEDLTSDNDIIVIKNILSLLCSINNKKFDDKFRYLFISIARSYLFNYRDELIYNINKDKTFYQDKIFHLCKSININNSISTILNEVIDKFDVYNKLTNLYNINESLIRIENLYDIANSLDKLEYSLEDFITYLEDLITNGLAIKYTVNTKGENAVKIMNIHKSKGLEFSLCYFTGMHNKFTIKDLNDKILFNEKYGLIIPFLNKDNEPCDTILKNLYREDYFIEEVSEKIRLFYVALTRCREKMIIVTSYDTEKEKYNHLVPTTKRLKYRSFLDILESIKICEKYLVKKETLYTHEYNNIKIKDLTNKVSDKNIIKREINLDYKLLENKHFSKEVLKILSDKEIELMEKGSKIHEELEYADTSNVHLDFILKRLGKDYINIFHEFEFIYELNQEKYHGIIDLMIEYNEHIAIIDFKLKNITDKNYLKQLNGYKNYIENITRKKVDTYLYSIIDMNLEEV